MQFEIAIDDRPDEVRVTVLGELDLATAPQLERALADVEAAEAITPIVLDLDQVEFLDSTGVRAVLAATARSQAHGDRLRLTRGSPPVRRLLRLVGADTRLPFHDAV